MNFDTYQAQAMRTAKPMEPQDDLMHAALGVCGEAGEFADAIKKHLVYGKPLDHMNAIEELGDLMWFVALGCQTLGVSMAYVAERNIAKLAKRYPEKYTDQLASERLDKADDGWIEWATTPESVCPVPDDTLVVYKMASGKIDITPRRAGSLRWSELEIIQRGNNIVAYRIVTAQQPDTPAAQ